MKNKNLLSLLSIFFLSSCYSVAHIKTDDVATKYPPTQASSIEIYALDVSNKKYEVLGKVIASADAGTNANIAVNKLKKEAAALGADAVINLRLAIQVGFWANGIKASGTAIKYTKN